ncbi:MAG: hypothetical protein Q8P67_24650, partial [archaeon]|nr:hypothetical protein [archaeon]
LSNLFDLVYVLEDRDVRKTFRLDEIPSSASPLASPSANPNSIPNLSSSSSSSSLSSSSTLSAPSSSPTSPLTPPQLTNTFSPFTIEKTRCGIRGWAWAQVAVFRYHALGTAPPLKLRFVILKRQALTVAKVRVGHTVYLRGGCALNSLGPGDRPTRLRGSHRAGFPFVVESCGAASLSLHFAARSLLDLTYWLNAFKAFASLLSSEAPPFISPSLPPLSSLAGSPHVFAGWLLFFTADGVWKHRYCILNARTCLLQLCKRVNLLRCSVEHASFSAPKRPDSRIPLCVSAGPLQQVSLLFDHAIVESIWASALRLAQLQPHTDFSVLSFDDIIERASASALAPSPPKPSSHSLLPLSDVDRAIALGRRRASSIVATPLQPLLASPRSPDDPNQLSRSSSHSPLLLRPVSDADHLEFRSQINAIMTANPRSLLRPLSRPRSSSTSSFSFSSSFSSSASSIIPASPERSRLRLLSLDGGILESGLRNVALLGKLEDLLQQDFVGSADVLVASSESVFLACALANGLTVGCCQKLLQLTVAKTLETNSGDMTAPRFSRKYFEILCQEVFIGRKLSSLPRGVLVPGFCTAHPHIRVSHNLAHLGLVDKDRAPAAPDEAIATLVLRSIGSPTFFSPFEGFLDPAVFAPNPSSTLLSVFSLEEARALCLLSIGSQRRAPFSWENSLNSSDWGVLDWAPVHSQLSELCAVEYSDSLMTAALGSRYHRFLLVIDSHPLASFEVLQALITDSLAETDPSAAVEWLSRNWLQTNNSS